MHEDLNTLSELLAPDADVPGAVLASFAGPLFELYGVPRLTMCERLSARDVKSEEVEGAAASLEAARVFWLYFRQRDSVDDDVLDRLQKALLGEYPSEEHVAAFSALVIGMIDQWSRLDPAVRCVGPDPVAARRELDILLSVSGDPEPESPPEAVVDSPEALAVFASPLLDDPSVGDSPERISEMMTRAQDYWNLALTSPDEFADELDVVVRRYARHPDDRAVVEAEANMMVARFHKLFPHSHRA